MQAATDVLIVGAGMAGLSAARDLSAAGYRAVVVDKGRGIGGRMANRRIGKARLDHGAQFITARDARFTGCMREWCKAGVAAEWYRSYPGSSESHARWRGCPAMNAIPKSLADGLDVRLTHRATSIREQGKGWQVTFEDKDPLSAQAVVLTAPVPQALQLLDQGGIVLEAKDRIGLERIQYHPCLAVLALLDGPSRVPAPGAVVPGHGSLSWIADNQIKGVSEVPAVTLHANPSFSVAEWDRDRHEAGEMLLNEIRNLLGAEVIEFQVHGWRYSKPVTVDACRCRELIHGARLVIAGDAFGGPRVEGAALSGWAAAQAVARQL